ncbi:MAG: type VI secretion system tube protein Hcp [Acidobacteriota bacterium]|nr:type VI secretion system tube protein Hcp [Acidobacteriota bacterium]
MKLLVSTCFSFLLATSALAQQRGAVVVNDNGINCVNITGETGFNATSYSLGGTINTGNPGSPGGSKTPSLKDLVVTKNFDDCSAPLIRLFLGGTVASTLKLIQYSNSTNTVRPFAEFTITLTNALMNSYEIDGSPMVSPTEKLTFTYSKVCVASVSARSDGSLTNEVRVCYDVAGKQLSS